MYRAKERGPQHLPVLLGPASNAHSVERLALETELRRALERDELVLHYQPQVDVAHRPHRRRRGAGALAAIRSAACCRRRVHPARRGDRPDRADRRMGAARRAAPAQRAVAATHGLAAAAHGGQPVAAAVPARAASSSDIAATCCATPACDPRAARARDHREHADARPAARRSRCCSSCSEMGVRARDRRLRHRLLVARVPQALPDRQRSRSTARSSRDIPADRGDAAITAGDHRDGAQPRPHGDRRRRRDAGAARLPRARGCDESQGYFFARPMAEEEARALLEARAATPRAATAR